jgi:hypothetical protein
VDSLVGPGDQGIDQGVHGRERPPGATQSPATDGGDDELEP